MDNSNAERIATKEEEMKVLEKIIKLVNSIGGDKSYVGRALDGCLDAARDNIEYDAWTSPMEYMETLDKKLREKEKELEETKQKINDILREHKKETDGLREAIIKLQGGLFADSFYTDMIEITQNAINDTDMQIALTAGIIANPENDEAKTNAIAAIETLCAKLKRLKKLHAKLEEVKSNKIM